MVAPDGALADNSASPHLGYEAGLGDVIECMLRAAFRIGRLCREHRRDQDQRIMRTEWQA